MFEYLSVLGTNLIAPLHTPKGVAIAIASAVGLSLLLAALFARTMVRLRGFTVLSNLCLITAASLSPNIASILMYLLLIPLNSYRLLEIVRLTRKVEAAAVRGDLSGLWLKPYMKANRLKAGTVLFRKGDEADSLYLLVEGSLHYLEIDKR